MKGISIRRSRSKSVERKPKNEISSSSSQPKLAAAQHKLEKYAENKELYEKQKIEKKYKKQPVSDDTKPENGSISDEYGFIKKPSKNKQPRVKLSPHSPRNEVEYFDDSLFDVGYIDASRHQNNIPITLGSISSDSNCDSKRQSISTEMSYYSTPHSSENAFINFQKLKNGDPNFYGELEEDHYAKLADFKDNVSQKPTSCNLTFYEQKAAEQRARSRSRNPDHPRARSRSVKRSSSRGRTRSKSRGLSASREVIESVYTKQHIPVGQVYKHNMNQNGQLKVDVQKTDNQKMLKNGHLNANNHSFSFGKVGDQTYFGKAHHNNLTDKEFPDHSQNAEDSCSMTLLEMDVLVCSKIEAQLQSANSLKPASIKMMMIATHVPENSWASKDEVSVKIGEIVTAIYKQNEWLFITTKDNVKGFVPYAYTKPVKTGSKDTKRPSSIEVKKSHTPNTSKPITGILKSSNQSQQKSKKSYPKFSVKVRTAADNHSLSSENSNNIDDFVYTRSKAKCNRDVSDCIVISPENTISKYNLQLHNEETGTYNSDSGISDPNSHNSDDLDLLHSPNGLKSIDVNSDSGISVSILSPCVPKEKIVSVTTEMLNSPSPTLSVLNDFSRRSLYRASATISDMPLGPLGARLSKLDLKEAQNKSKPQEKSKMELSNDTRARAQNAQNSDKSLRPEIPKDYNGPRVTVVYDYKGENEDDLDVKASDIVTILNGEDIEWIWVQRRDGKEGFIPREYVIQLVNSLTSQKRCAGMSLL